MNQNKVQQVSELELSSNNANNSDEGGGMKFNSDIVVETDNRNFGTRTTHEVEIEAEIGEDLSQDNQLSEYMLSIDSASVTPQTFFFFLKMIFFHGI